MASRDIAERMLHALNQAELAARRRREGQCVYCGNNPPVFGRVGCIECLARLAAKSARRYADARERVFNHYGWVCLCCGETCDLFLTIDHKRGGGQQHRAKVGRDLYGWLVRNDFPEDFETLCFNCNCGRARNHGVCPHKEEGHKRG
jgi:DNA-binding transcriptional LysR family regulator